MARGHHNLEHYSAIQEARLQLFLDFAEDKYLNRLAANLGIDRPLGHSDDLFRALVKRTALTRHSTLSIFTDVLDLLIGPAKSRVFELTEDLPLGSTRATLTSTRGLPQVGILRIDPETSREESIEYVYVDYLNNEVWFRTGTVTEHLSKQPKTTIQDDVLVGDDFVDLIEPDLFPQGAFMATIDRAGPNEEMVFIISRGVLGGGGNRVYRTGTFDRSQGREPAIGGELQDIAHKAGETFEWAGSINIPGKLVASVTSGSSTISVEAVDSDFPIDKSFPTQAFSVVLSPGTPNEETVSVAVNDRVVPTSTFTVVAAATTVNGSYSVTDFDVVDETGLIAIIPAGAATTSPIEVILDRGTPEEEALVVSWNGGDFDIVGPAPTQTHTGASTVELPVAITNDHLIGSAVVLQGPGNAVLAEFIEGNTETVTNTASFELTRVERFPEGPAINPTSPYTEYSVIINQGEVNEDIIGMEGSDKSTDVMAVLSSNEDALVNSHYPGEPVRPATIVIDGTGWTLRERDNKVDIFIPEINLPDNELRDASYLHYDGPLPYVESDVIPAGGVLLHEDTIIPVDPGTDPAIMLREFPEVGLLLVSDGTPATDEYVKYTSTRVAELSQGTYPVGTVASVVNSGGSTVAINTLINGYESDTGVLPNPAVATYDIRVGGLTFTVTKVELNVGASTGGLGYNVKLTVKSGVGIATVGDGIRVLGIRLEDTTVIRPEASTVYVDGSAIPGDPLSIRDDTGWVIMSDVPAADIPEGKLVYQDILGFRISIDSRFTGDDGVAVKAAGASLLLAGKRYDETNDNIGDAVLTTIVLAAGATRGDTSIAVNSDFASAFDLQDPVIKGLAMDSTSDATKAVVLGAEFDASYVGKLAQIDTGAFAGSILTVGSVSGDELIWATPLTGAPAADDEFSVFEVPLINLVIDEGVVEEIRTVTSIEVEATDYTLGIKGGLVYDHVALVPVTLAAVLDGVVDSADTLDINTAFTGPNMFDINFDEIQVPLVTTLDEPILSRAVSASEVTGGSSGSVFIYDGGDLLPAAPTRFNVIINPNTITAETIEVTRGALGTVTPGTFPNSAELTITDGDLFEFDHSFGETILPVYDQIEVADSSGIPTVDGKVVINFGYSNQEIVRYISNEASTGTLTLRRPTVFDNDHEAGETVDLTSVFSVPDDRGVADPFYLSPDPFARLRFWLDLAKAAGICINLTSDK
jgi:hypothetical protein